MEDYPRDLMRFERRFDTEDGCRQYLFQLRWPEGFVCPACAGRQVTQLGELYRCRGCRRQVSVTAGTVFHRSHLPLRVWFRAMWWVCSQKNGASALGLQRVLGLGSYETAWLMLHKLRRAMVRPGRERLSGIVEVDETYIGGLEEGLRGRRNEGRKALVVIAAQVKGRNIGRIRMRRIPNASATSLHPFVLDAVEPGSTLHTDGWVGYCGLEARGYSRKTLVNATGAAELMPRVHRVASLLKRWLLGTHQGAVSHAHLDYYLDEFTFRFNRRASQHRGKLLYRLVQQAAQVPHSQYKAIVKHVSGLRYGKHNW
jgi:transposase-like protein